MLDEGSSHFHVEGVDGLEAKAGHSAGNDAILHVDAGQTPGDGHAQQFRDQIVHLLEEVRVLVLEELDPRRVRRLERGLVGPRPTGGAAAARQPGYLARYAGIAWMPGAGGCAETAAANARRHWRGLEAQPTSLAPRKPA